MPSIFWMEISFTVEAKWTKLSMKREIRIKTFYDMDALKGLPHVFSFSRERRKTWATGKKLFQLGRSYKNSQNGSAVRPPRTAAVKQA